MRGRAVVARRAHNPKVKGASPSPATIRAGSSIWKQQRSPKPWVEGSSPSRRAERRARLIGRAAVLKTADLRVVKVRVFGSPPVSNHIAGSLAEMARVNREMPSIPLFQYPVCTVLVITSSGSGYRFIIAEHCDFGALGWLSGGSCQRKFGNERVYGQLIGCGLGGSAVACGALRAGWRLYFQALPAPDGMRP